MSAADPTASKKRGLTPVPAWIVHEKRFAGQVVKRARVQDRVREPQEKTSTTGAEMSMMKTARSEGWNMKRGRGSSQP